jgi:hypothetical protein
MTKQRRWQLKKQAEGNCMTCGKPRNLYAERCDTCHAVERLRTRAACGHQPWREGGRGRPPLIRG